MDPVTQGALGACAALLVAKKETRKFALVVGTAAGLLPDVDIFIQSSENPLLALQYHRHFTHSLFFVPLGALLVALVFRHLMRAKRKFKEIYLYAFVAFATHGLLDTCTAYGTQLFWPFYTHRISWNAIAIVDPIYTFLILLGISLFFKKKSKKGLVFCICIAQFYLFFGFWQNAKVQRILRLHAAQKGHQVSRVFVNPSPFNIILWKGLYTTQTHYHSHAIRVPFWGDSTLYEGESLEKSGDFMKLFPEESVQKKDLKTYSWFSDAYFDRYPHKKSNYLGDLRYSPLPHQMRPLWGIRINPAKPDSRVMRSNSSLEFPELSFSLKKQLEIFGRMLLGLETLELKTYSY